MMPTGMSYCPRCIPLSRHAVHSTGRNTVLGLSFTSFFFFNSWVFFSWSPLHTGQSIWKKIERKEQSCAITQSSMHVLTLTPLSKICARSLQPSLVARTVPWRECFSLGSQITYSQGGSGALCLCLWRIDLLEVYIQDLIHWLFGLCTSTQNQVYSLLL